MKKIFFILTIAIASFGQSAFAQCSDKTIKKLCKEGLGTYIFESAAFKPLSAFGAKKNLVEAAFSVYSQESYRVLNLCQGFSDVVEFAIYDTDHNLLFSNKSDKSVKFYDFVAQKSGDFTIEFKIPPADMKSTSCCVAFAIGYK
ncbi:MAG TPA: hypothetical protein PK509_05240 [Catalimonadaceae bacterium]|jgi:hypothetical protein|nr:hypothetical protein [Catalimonadaceae bacterium]HPI09524.1 hypothetical protein [Catalimonadaceae bacterium]